MKHPNCSSMLPIISSIFILIFGTACDLPSNASALIEPADLSTRKALAPERGFISSAPAETWEQGLITANGTIGASVLSRPLDETIVFSHERMFLPERDPILPPLTAPRLFEIRRLIDRGLYRQAEQLTLDVSEQDGFLYPDCLFPAFDLRIRMMKTKGKVRDYLRSVDFRTSLATVHWSDDRGVFERRIFVSRADGAAILSITGPGPGSVDCRLEFTPRDPEHDRFKRNIQDLETTAEGSSLTFTNSFAHAYPGSIHKLEGMAWVIAEGGVIRSKGKRLFVSGADEVLIFIDLDVIFDPNKTTLDEMKNVLSSLPADFERLLERHAEIHGDLFDRMRLDLGGRADHGLTTEELLEKTSDDTPSKALIEKEFDAGRYNIISSTGELPPTLQGVWAGTYNPPWASDFTHNGNVPFALASMLMGNMPELLLAYTNYIESIVPYLELNAQRIFGARGVVLPSRSTTDGFNNSFTVRFPGAFWVAGAAWAAHFFYDYYLYTGDYQSLVPLINDYWYPSLASTHNYKALFNMDISGGMPAVIIKMLIASQPGMIQLLPALPSAWPSGTIEGVLCRGQVELKSLHWEPGTITLSLKSSKDQEVTLQTPGKIEDVSMQTAAVSFKKEGDSSLVLSLTEQMEVTLTIVLE